MMAIFLLTLIVALVLIAYFSGKNSNEDEILQLQDDNIRLAGQVHQLKVDLIKQRWASLQLAGPPIRNIHELDNVS